MRAGALRHRVVVKEPITDPDAMGQRILTFEPNATRYASIAPLKQEDRQVARAGLEFPDKLDKEKDLQQPHR